MKLNTVTAKEGQLPESVTESLVTNAGENGKSTSERECWSLCNVKYIVGFRKKSRVLQD